LELLTVKLLCEGGNVVEKRITKLETEFSPTDSREGVIACTLREDRSPPFFAEGKGFLDLAAVGASPKLKIALVEGSVLLPSLRACTWRLDFDGKLDKNNNVIFFCLGKVDVELAPLTQEVHEIKWSFDSGVILEVPVEKGLLQLKLSNLAVQESEDWKLPMESVIGKNTDWKKFFEPGDEDAYVSSFKFSQFTTKMALSRKHLEKAKIEGRTPTIESSDGKGKFSTRESTSAMAPESFRSVDECWFHSPRYILGGCLEASSNRFRCSHSSCLGGTSRCWQNF
jgi:hypothetical protein